MTNADVKVVVASLEMILKFLKEKDPKAIERFEQYIESLKSQQQLKGEQSPLNPTALYH